MNPKHHAMMTKLVNIGIAKRDQQDIPEFNRIQTHPDVISAVMIQYGNDGNDTKSFRWNGKAHWDSTINKATFDMFHVMPGDDKGVRVHMDRKRLIELLQGFDSDDVELTIKENDAPLWIGGNYDSENVTVQALLMPRIENE